MNEFLIGPVTLALDVVGSAARPIQTGDQQLDDCVVTPGGSQLNMAYGLVKLGHRAGVIGNYSSDPIGVICRKDIEEAGIDTSMMKPQDTQTYTAFVLAEPCVPRRTIFANTNHFSSAPLPVLEELVPKLGSFKYYGQLAVPIFGWEVSRYYERFYKAAKESGLITFMEPCEDPQSLCMDFLKPILPWVDIFLPGYRELRMLTKTQNIGIAAASLLSIGVSMIAVKLGCDGCLVFSGDKRHYSPAYDVPPLDLTGAGDGFAAGFMHGYALDWTFSKTADFANAYASSNIMGLGPRAGMMDEKHVRDMVMGGSYSRRGSVNAYI